MESYTVFAFGKEVRTRNEIRIGKSELVTGQRENHGQITEPNPRKAHEWGSSKVKKY